MTNKIYSEINGQGQDVVLIHGWGMHGGLWGDFNTLLSDSFQTHNIDLPGFGFSKNIKGELTLNTLSEAIEEYIEKIQKPVNLVGWSLGGLVILNILKRKNIAVNKIVLIATNPCFIKKQGWKNGVEQVVFDDFAHDLQNDYKKTLKRFLSLQTRGSDLDRVKLRELNEKLNDRGSPDISALENGLKILSNTDLRSKKIYKTPAMIVLGEKDTLVPVSVKTEFEKKFLNSEIVVLKRTGHAPFISKPEVCAEKIKNFLNE